MKIYAINISGKQLLYNIHKVTDAYDFLMSDPYWLANPPMYVQEVKTTTFDFPEGFE